MSKRTRADSYDAYLANPAPGPKWQAEKGILRIPGLGGAVQSYLACVIDLTHDEWGFCFPTRKQLQQWTGRGWSALDRAIAKAKHLDLIDTRERPVEYARSDSTLIIPVWEPFFTAFHRVEALRSRNAGVTVVGRGSKTGEHRRESEPHLGFEIDEHKNLSKDYLSLKELSSSPSGEPVRDFQKEKEKRGLSAGALVDGPANPSGLDASQRVDRYVAAEPLCRVHQLSPEAYRDAVAAEAREVGSGRSIVSKAATDAWRARRRRSA